MKLNFLDAMVFVVVFVLVTIFGQGFVAQFMNYILPPALATVATYIIAAAVGFVVWLFYSLVRPK